jgi:hypothetical protein
MLSRGYAINLNKDGLLMCLIQLSVLTIEFLKCSHVLETYLLDLPYDLRRALCNFKCLNHRLPIERGHFGGVERDDRVCDICDTGSLGDEYHYLFQCTFFNNERKKLLPHNLTIKPNTVKFQTLFNSEDVYRYYNLAKFCKIVLSVVN